jgi:hypothetical protein
MGAKRMEPSMLMSFLPGTREMWVLKLLDRDKGDSSVDWNLTSGEKLNVKILMLYHIFTTNLE